MLRRRPQGPCSHPVHQATISKARKAATYAKAGYALATGATKTVTLKLGKKLRARARTKAGLPARLTVVPDGGAATTFRVKLHRM